MQTIYTEVCATAIWPRCQVQLTDRKEDIQEARCKKAKLILDSCVLNDHWNFGKSGKAILLFNSAPPFFNNLIWYGVPCYLVSTRSLHYHTTIYTSGCATSYLDAAPRRTTTRDQTPKSRAWQSGGDQSGSGTIARIHHSYIHHSTHTRYIVFWFSPFGDSLRWCMMGYWWR